MTPQQIEQMRTAFYAECTEIMCEIRFSTMQPEQVFDWFISHIPTPTSTLDGYIYHNQFYASLDDLKGHTFSDNDKPIPVYFEARKEKEWPTDEEIKQAEDDFYIACRRSEFAESNFMNGLKWLKDYMTK